MGSSKHNEDKLRLVEQSLPGQEDAEEEIPDRRSLPDIWIFSEDGFSLLIESKVMCGLTRDQIERHLKTAERRGFSKAWMLVLCIEGDNQKMPKGVLVKTWSELYEWMIKRTDESEWAKLFSTYCEIAEARMIQSAYLTKGKITKFTGIPFNSDNPYNYTEAKRLLTLLLDELKTDKTFVKKLGIDASLDSRTAITGKKAQSVWDFLRLKGSKGDKSFTAHPHLTAAIGSMGVLTLVTLPNGVKRSIRKKVLDGGFKGFESVVSQVLSNMGRVFGIDPKVKPYLKVLQRHYPSQRSMGIEDGIIKFDLRTVFKAKKSGVKYQPQYLKAAYEILTHRKANLQLEIGVEIPYSQSEVLKTPKAVNLIKEAFLAFKPFLDHALNS